MRILTILFFICLSWSTGAQPNTISLDQAIETALKNNPGIKAAAADVAHQRQLQKTTIDLPKTDVSLLYGQYNGYARNDNNITVTQTIPWSALGSQGSVNRSLTSAAGLKKSMTENELTHQVRQVYYQLSFLNSRHALLQQEDSIYEGFFKAASFRFKTGETNLLERTTAETERNEIRNNLQQNESEIIVVRTQLKALLNSETLPEITATAFAEISSDAIQDTLTALQNPSLAYMRQLTEVAKRTKKLEAAKAAPDLKVGFFTQTLIDVVDPESGQVATAGNRFTGFQVGVAIPLWFVPHQARIKAAEYNRQASEYRYQEHTVAVQGEWEQAEKIYQKNKISLAYYRTSAVPNAELIIKHSQAAFRAGEIGYAEYLLGIHQAISIKEQYLQTLNAYNQSVVYLLYLSGHN
jgi:cobalt-zinc-cadmium resistance protein CzcA